MDKKAVEFFYEIKQCIANDYAGDRKIIEQGH
jgi:hypothetical protein